MAGDNKLSIGCLTHPVDRPRLASPSGILVAPRRLCHDRNILVRSAYNRPLRIESGNRSDINNEAGVLLRTLPDHLRPRLQAEQRTTLRSGILGVEAAELPVRFTSTVHGSEADPHVLPAVQSCSGCASLQAYLLFFDCAVADAATTRESANAAHRITKHPSLISKHASPD